MDSWGLGFLGGCDNRLGLGLIHRLPGSTAELLKGDSDLDVDPDSNATQVQGTGSVPTPKLKLKTQP